MHICIHSFASPWSNTSSVGLCDWHRNEFYPPESDTDIPKAKAACWEGKEDGVENWTRDMGRFASVKDTNSSGKEVSETLQLCSRKEMSNHRPIRNIYFYRYWPLICSKETTLSIKLFVFFFMLNIESNMKLWQILLFFFSKWTSTPFIILTLIFTCHYARFVAFALDQISFGFVLLNDGLC